jgi:hypothetical protein
MNSKTVELVKIGIDALAQGDGEMALAVASDLRQEAARAASNQRNADALAERFVSAVATWQLARAVAG